MMKSPMKPPRTYDEQLDILISRGLTIADRKRGIGILRFTNYYRLSGYCLSFINSDGTFIEGTSLDNIYDLYLFDEKLRHLLFEVIEPIELRLRAELAYVLSNNHQTALAYMEPSICNRTDTDQFAKHLSSYYEEVSKSVDQAFVRHNLNKYGGLPIWAAVELWSFGHLSSYFNTLNSVDKKHIAEPFGTDISRIGGWFHHLSTVRNICAHSGRIYNRDIKIKVALYPEDRKLINTPNRIAETLIVMKRIYSGSGKWLYFIDALYELINTHKSVVDVTVLGLPNHWYYKFTGRRKDQATVLMNNSNDDFAAEIANEDDFEL